MRGSRATTNRIGHFIRNAAGFTLIELLIVVSIAGILVALAMPSFANFLDREKIEGVSGEFTSAVIVARSAAIKSGIPVVFCSSSDGNSCGGDWSDGWLSFRDDNRDSALDSNEPVVLRHTGSSSAIQVSVLSLSGDKVNAVRFNYRGAPDSALSISVSRGDYSQLLSVSHFGKPRRHD